MASTELSTKNVALLTIFAALSFIICKFIPGIPIVGIPDAQIKFDAAVAPLYGMVIGPYMGFLAALIGGLIAAGNPFSVLTSFCTAISAMVAGFLTLDKISKNSKIQGWPISAVILATLIAGWYATWVGQKAIFYPVLHFAGLFAILITRGWVANSFKEIGVPKEGWQFKPASILSGVILFAVGYMFTKPYMNEAIPLNYLSLPLYIVAAVLILYGIFGAGRFSFISAVFLADYCGIIADHMLGNLIFIATIDIFIPLSVVEEYFLKPLGLPDIPSLFMYMVPVSAIERILMTVVATIVGVGLISGLYKAGLIPKKQ
ncbi:MAG: ECF transporter S component [Candidatus Bathyarchaeia archaeon]|nr:ECF transporter S component [Candidatus Bathyarchaeota archaeon]